MQLKITKSESINVWRVHPDERPPDYQLANHGLIKSVSIDNDV